MRNSPVHTHIHTHEGTELIKSWWRNSIVAVGIYIWLNTLHIIKHQSLIHIHSSKSYIITHIWRVFGSISFCSDLSCRFATTLHAAVNQITILLKHLHICTSVSSCKSTLWSISVIRYSSYCVKFILVSWLRKVSTLPGNKVLFNLQRSYIMLCLMIRISM